MQCNAHRLYTIYKSNKNLLYKKVNLRKKNIEFIPINLLNLF